MSQNLKKYAANTGAQNQVVQYGASVSKQISANETTFTVKNKTQINVPAKNGTVSISKAEIYQVRKLHQ
ncbi:hypothetical protein PHYPO_G00039110 [Pangasianodon hypophthalmus]|uniref:Uncharacterized protein n=1 Tax=Pangasianodon hypophthalmus TaxID=310915 RepID=A0A5N5ML27_PANHP|nr:hypothetical protein PHYPO_G00039110 [Pangasianodon hypophthalmus]